MTKLTGIVRTWKLGPHSRRYSEVTMPWKLANQLTMANRYNALNGKGEQREINDGHLRKLKNVMLDGQFTPAPGALGLSASHRAALVIKEQEDGSKVFELEVSEDNPLSLTDAGHRMGAIETIIKDTENKLKTASGAEKTRLEELLSDAQQLPVPFLLHIDGDTKRDFVALQEGRAVDAAHMFSLKVQQKELDDPACKLAVEVARELHKNSASPFHKFIRFDTIGKATLPITTLCARGASDLSTSLVGLARLGLAHGKDASWLSRVVIATDTIIHEGASQLTDYGKLLTPPETGTKGSATMLIGAAIGLAYLLIRDGLEKADEATTERFLAAARASLDEKVVGNFSGATKREVMGRFVKLLLNENEAAHEGVPLLLAQTLSPSCFGAGPLPKELKLKTEKPAKPAKATKKVAKAKAKAAKRKSMLPDVDGPLPAEAGRIRELVREGKEDEAYELSMAAYEESASEEGELVGSGSFEEIQG